MKQVPRITWGSRSAPVQLCVHPNGGTPKYWIRSGTVAWFGSTSLFRTDVWEQKISTTRATVEAKRRKGYVVVGNVTAAIMEALCDATAPTAPILSDSDRAMLKQVHLALTKHAIYGALPAVSRVLGSNGRTSEPEVAPAVGKAASDDRLEGMLLEDPPPRTTLFTAREEAFDPLTNW